MVLLLTLLKFTAIRPTVSNPFFFCHAKWFAVAANISSFPWGLLSLRRRM